MPGNFNGDDTIADDLEIGDRVLFKWHGISCVGVIKGFEDNKIEVHKVLIESWFEWFK